MANRHEVERIVRAAVDQGFDVKRTTRGHWIFRIDGRYVCDMSGTPSSAREIANKLSKLRRAGLRY